MTPAQFKSIRKSYNLTQTQLARLLRIEDIRTIRRYETGERPVSGPVSVLMVLVEEFGPTWVGHASASTTSLLDEHDPVCADCGGTGTTYQTERRCACQPLEDTERK